MKCLLVNCRSIKNKVPDLVAVVDLYNPDIIFATVSWLNADISNDFFGLSWGRSIRAKQ